MNIQKIEINKLNPAAYNPRRDLKPGDPDYEKLKTSIETFGYVEPIVWNSRTGSIVSGHQRLKIIIEQGVQEVAVSVVDLDLGQEKILNVALNKISGSWDEEKLSFLLEEISHLPDIDIGLTGFDTPEISSLFDRFLDKGGEEEGGDVAFPEIPVTKPGDLIILGSHRILCGDTTQEESLRLLLGQEKIDLVHMDLPYGVSYDAKNRPGANKDNISSQWKAIKNDDLKGEDHTRWFKQILGILKPFLKDNASAYFWDGFVNFGSATQVLSEEGFHVSNVITWVKPTACPSFADYWFKSEFLLYGWLKSNTPHRWFGPKGESNVWFVDREPAGDYEHPTMKPTELACHVLENSSLRGDIIFDGCMGAGFNLLACQQLDRMFRGVEIEPTYVDVAVKRFIRMFGPNSVSEEILKKYGSDSMESKPSI